MDHLVEHIFLLTRTVKRIRTQATLLQRHDQAVEPAGIVRRKYSTVDCDGYRLGVRLRISVKRGRPLGFQLLPMRMVKTGFGQDVCRRQCSGAVARSDGAQGLQGQLGIGVKAVAILGGNRLHHAAMRCIDDQQLSTCQVLLQGLRIIVFSRHHAQCQSGLLRSLSQFGQAGGGHHIGAEQYHRLAAQRSGPCGKSAAQSHQADPTAPHPWHVCHCAGT